MMQAKLQLKEYSIINFLFSTQNIVTKSNEIVEIKNRSTLDVDFEITMNAVEQNKNNAFAVILKIYINNDKISFEKNSFKLNCEMIGLFEYNSEMTEKIELLIIKNALMMLYGTMRGIIAQLTANTIIGKYILPAVYIDKIIDKKIEKIKNTNPKQANA